MCDNKTSKEVYGVTPYFSKIGATALDKPSFECLQTRRQIRTKTCSQRPLF